MACRGDEEEELLVWDEEEEEELELLLPLSLALPAPEPGGAGVEGGGGGGGLSRGAEWDRSRGRFFWNVRFFKTSIIKLWRLVGRF